LRRPRFITFDVFGTLFRVEEVASREVMEDIVKRNNLSMTPEELAEVWWEKSYRVAHEGFLTVREATKVALSRLLQEVGSEDDPEGYTRRLLEHWAATDPYPEVPRALDTLRDFELGIVSNIDDDVLEELLRRSGLQGTFTVKVTSEACRTYKPDARIFEEALKRAGCRPEDALHIGDSPVEDVLGPKRVGMMAGWVNRRGEELKGRVPQPDFVVADLEKAAEIIRRSAPGP
jgi:2-haloalkanoic acid dehalogenase type II